MRNQVSNP